MSESAKVVVSVEYSALGIGGWFAPFDVAVTQGRPPDELAYGSVENGDSCG